MTPVTLTYCSRPWTLNIERQGSIYVRAALVREWRTAFCYLAKQARTPGFLSVAVTVVPHLRNRRSMPDTGACFGAAKAAIDGLVDAGVLAEDGPAVVRSLTFLAPVVDGTDSLELRLVALDALEVVA